MTLWMNRAGRRGEAEQSFIDDGRIYLQWQEIDQDLSTIADKAELRRLLEQVYSSAPIGKISSHLGQFWIFINTMQKGDWVVLPSKFKRIRLPNSLLEDLKVTAWRCVLTRC